MGDVRDFKAAKEAATRTRIAGGLDALVVDLHAKGKAAEDAAEADRIRRMCASEIGLAFQKAYVLLGMAAESLIISLHQGKYQEHLLKTKIKGE